MLPVPYFHITVTAPPNYARCCEPISATAMVADAGQCRGDHRACPRSALRRRHRRGARRAAPPGPSSSVYTRTFIAWSAAAGSPKTPAPGTRRGGTSWFPSRLLPGWYGANSGRCCRRSVLISSSPTPHGASLGSSTSPPGEMVNRRCSTTSPATSFASLLPTPALSASTTKQSPSNTRNVRPAVHEPVVSAARSSCAASSSTCCRAVFTRSATSACGIPRNATGRPGAADAATPGATHCRVDARPCCPLPVPPSVGPVPPIEPRVCPHCQQGRVIFIRTLIRQQAMCP
jgi:hypothetical protein